MLLAGVVGLVLMSGFWKSGIAFNVAGADVDLPGLVRDVGLLAARARSRCRSRRSAPREQNQFTWAPMAEVAKLFAGIFLTIIPVIAMLRAGVDGPFGAVVVRRDRPDGQPDPGDVFLGHRRAAARSSTTRRPTWCSSTPPAATRRR